MSEQWKQNANVKILSKQGDLDRQRLLGNRQRIGYYESNLEDGDTEGLEHQERWAINLQKKNKFRQWTEERWNLNLICYFVLILWNEILSHSCTIYKKNNKTIHCEKVTYTLYSHKPQYLKKTAKRFVPCDIKYAH